MNTSLSQTVILLLNQFADRIREGLKELLESKHLYQNVRINHEDLLEKAPKSSSDVLDISDYVTDYFHERVAGPWSDLDPFFRTVS
jgi:hypothetical protein